MKFPIPAILVVIGLSVGCVTARRKSPYDRIGRFDPKNFTDRYFLYGGPFHAPMPPLIVESEPGRGEAGSELWAIDDEHATQIIAEDFEAAEDAARTFPLNPALDLLSSEVFDPELVQHQRWTWEELTIYRIHSSYKMQPLSTVWQDDKLDQKCIVEGAVPLAKYVDYFAGTDAENAEKSRKRGLDLELLLSKAAELIHSQEKFIVKASHGANSNAIFPFCDPSKADYTVDAVKLAVEKAISSQPEATENWQLRMVEPGFVLQKCYDSVGTDKGRPLEVKILTEWGRVVGATLETRPKEFWITRGGQIWTWEGDQTSSGLLTRFFGKGKTDSEPLDDETMSFIASSLERQWPLMRAAAETIAQTFGNDELRVDFFFGNPEGPRLNEVTYMGGAARYPFALQEKLANTLIAGYASREGSCLSGVSSRTCHVPVLSNNCHKYSSEPEKMASSPGESMGSWVRYGLFKRLGINLGQGGL